MAQHAPSRQLDCTLQLREAPEPPNAFKGAALLSAPRRRGLAVLSTLAAPAPTSSAKVLKSWNRYWGRTSLRLTLTTHARWSSRQGMAMAKAVGAVANLSAAGPGLCGSPIPRSGATARLDELPDAPKFLLRNVYAGSSGLILGSLPYPNPAESGADALERYLLA